MYRRNVDQGIKDWVGPGYLNSHYDPYSQEARDIYWRQIEDKLGGMGMDAWWMDNSEPDIHSNTDREELTQAHGSDRNWPGRGVLQYLSAGCSRVLSTKVPATARRINACSF